MSLQGPNVSGGLFVNIAMCLRGGKSWRHSASLWTARVSSSGEQGAGGELRYLEHNTTFLLYFNNTDWILRLAFNTDTSSMLPNQPPETLWTAAEWINHDFRCSRLSTWRASLAQPGPLPTDAGGNDSSEQTAVCAVVSLWTALARKGQIPRGFIFKISCLLKQKQWHPSRSLSGFAQWIKGRLLPSPTA